VEYGNYSLRVGISKTSISIFVFVEVINQLSWIHLSLLASSLVQLAKVVLKGEYDPIPYQYSSSLDRYITWLLNLDFKKRPNISQLIQYVDKKVTEGYHGEDIAFSASHIDSTCSLSVEDEKDYLSEDSLDQKEQQGSEGEKNGVGVSRRGLEPSIEGAPAQSEPIVRHSYSPQAKREGKAGTSPHRRRKQPIDGVEPHIISNRKNAHGSEIPMKKQDDRTEHDPLVAVDVQRVQMLLRRENSQHRKLLQMKTFFVDVKAPGHADAVLLPTAQQSKESIIDKIRDSAEKIERLDKSLRDGNMPKSLAIRYVVLLCVCVCVCACVYVCVFMY